MPPVLPPRKARIMHYFSIHTPADQHIGFLILLADNEHEQPSQSGQFAVKLHDDGRAADHPNSTRILSRLQNESPLFWRVEGDHIVLFDGTHNHLGSIRQEHLRLSGQDLLLNDLTGNL